MTCRRAVESLPFLGELLRGDEPGRAHTRTRQSRVCGRVRQSFAALFPRGQDRKRQRTQHLTRNAGQDPRAVGHAVPRVDEASAVNRRRRNLPPARPRPRGRRAGGVGTASHRQGLAPRTVRTAGRDHRRSRPTAWTSVAVGNAHGPCPREPDALQGQASGRRSPGRRALSGRGENGARGSGALPPPTMAAAFQAADMERTQQAP